MSSLFNLAVLVRSSTVVTLALQSTGYFLTMRIAMKYADLIVHTI